MFFKYILPLQWQYREPRSPCVHELSTGSPAPACLSLHLPSEPIRKESGEFASIRCGVHIKCNPDHFQFTWFVFQATGHHQLDLTRSKYTSRNYTLTIDPLSRNDSGDYICAVVGGTTSEYQQIGHGTTIVVRGKSLPRYLHSHLAKVVIQSDCWSEF